MELAFRNESWHGAGVPFEQPVIQFMELLVRKSDETLTNSPYVYLVGNAKKCAQRHMLAPNNVFLENGHGERVTAIFLQMEFVNHGANGQHLKCSVDPSKTPIDILSPIRWDGTGGFAALNDVLIRLQAHVTQVHWSDTETLMALRRVWGDATKGEAGSLMHKLQLSHCWDQVKHYLEQQFEAVDFAVVTSCRYIAQFTVGDSFMDYLARALARWTQVEAVVPEAQVARFIWDTLGRLSWENATSFVDYLKTGNTPNGFKDLAQLGVHFEKSLKSMNRVRIAAKI
jgi:hypothetical protein